MLGVCYYPEHWRQDMWQQDAADMKALGLSYVRIGEFTWSRIEPARDDFHFEWLDLAIETLADAGLKIVFGTPTATPPKWLIDEFPEILPVDPATGKARGFGSRRHYDFSSERYLQEALRITDVLTKRYGGHPDIVGWQTDNELCCHDTALSVSRAARTGFRNWCAERYANIEKLNAAWGTVFWSMEYKDFSEIELPVGAVTETNPAHRLAYRRYSSDKVVEFHRKMVAVIRENAPGKWITHNFIPKEDLYVDAYALGKDLDIASYDNYPLGRTDMFFRAAGPDDVRRYMRTGHPDFSAYYHDTSRSFVTGGYWVMEQQPGPVNWAPHNPKPAKGMVRLWSLEAFAHGADCVSYFRWRQVPFAQEQMHAGLRRPDNVPAAAWPEVEQVFKDISKIDIAALKKAKSPVAIVTDVEALWHSDIEQQGAGYDFVCVEFAWYSALRRLGVDVDFISKASSFDEYRIVVVPCLPHVDEAFARKCKAAQATIIFGPRSGAKTEEFSIPDTLAPGALQQVLPVKVVSVETLRPDCPEKLIWGEGAYHVHSWCEELEPAGDVEVLATYADDAPAVVQAANIIYLAALTDDGFLQDLFEAQCGLKGVETFRLPQDMRLCRRGELYFAFNYAEVPQAAPASAGAEFVVGERHVQPRDVTVWRQPAHSNPGAS